jgi:signal transduction histidine kinase
MALAAVYFAFPKGGTAQAVIYEGLGGTASLAILWAVRLHRPAQRLPWILFALGNTCFVVGDVIAIFQLNPPVPSATDIFYLTGYPLFAGGLLLLMFSAGGRNRVAALADVGIVTFAFAIVQWVAVMGPAIRSGGGHLSARIVSGLYPAMDIVLLAGLVGFFVSSAWRTTSFRYLLAATTLLVIGDETAGLMSGYAAGDAIDVTWMLSYVFLGAAALHPSMRALSQPRRLPVLRVSAWRVSLLAGALLTGPVVLFVQKLRGEPLDVYEVAAFESAIALLVVARLTGILRSLERIRIRERTARTLAEEAHWQLALKNEELVEADKLKDEFVALISHDLRTPLTSIIGYVELVLDEDVDPPLDDERRTYLRVVARSSERLLRLVDDLLFVARLQAGRLVLETAPLDLAEATSQAVDEARPHAELKGLAITFLGDTGVQVEADRGRIFQLLDNLISNAIKFTPEGGRVDVRVLRTADGAVLEVTDTGIGLAPGESEQVFERFFRSERASNRQIPGTGLGLFIARAIAEAHGGTISASSPHGEGTTFRIELPVRVPPSPDANAEELVA